MKLKRQAGVLMHISSLPGPEGIGTLGRPAHDFVDFLERVGVRVWQMLPVGPAGGGDSPYQSPSTFAGNPLLIDFALLREEGLLDERAEAWPDGPVDYPRVLRNRRMMLERAFALSYARLESEVADFRRRNAWAEDYALFMALREHFEGARLDAWPDRAARLREPEAIEQYRALLSDRIDRHLFAQYLFERQWAALKAYAAGKGVRLFGDLPIYTAADSADVWTHPELFKLDEERRPVKVAGVPPDYFSEDGQLWGNPVYAWKAHKASDYAWWVERMRGVANRFDWVRIDHFIGFVNYYSVDYGAPNAREGAWKKGPGAGLFRAICRALPELTIVAEDLGVTNPKVDALRKQYGFPGMKVLQFGFDPGKRNPHRPERIKKNCVAYTGTHDNDTTLGWWASASPGLRRAVRKRLPLGPGEDVVERMVHAVMMSRAATCVIPMQDILGLGNEARMNLPGTPEGNWRWRMSPDALSDELTQRLKRLIDESGRGADA